MINATTISSPMDIGMDRGTGVGASKAQSDAPEFGDVLDSKIKEQQAAPEAKDSADTKPVDDSAAPKSEAKSEAKPEAKAEPKADAKVETEHESEAQAASKSSDEEAAQQTAEQSAQQLAAQAAAALAAVAAKPVEANTDTQEQTTELPIQQIETSQSEKTQLSANMQAAAVVVEDRSSEMLVSAAGAVQVADSDAELPATDTKPKDDNAKPAESSTSRPTFFGFAPKEQTQAAPEAQAKAVNNLGLEQLYRGMETNNTQPKAEEESAQQPPLVVAKNAAMALTPEAFFASAQPKPVESPANDTTLTPQMVSALADGMDAQALAMGTSTGSDNTGSKGADTGQPQSNGQEGVFAINGRTSFDSVIRGLDAPAQAAAPQTPNTAEAYTKIVDQVVREIRLRQYQGQSDLMVKLNPAELGAIRLQVSQTEQGMTTQLQASSDQVKGLLQAHLPALMEALSDAGLKMDTVTVTSAMSFNSLMQDNTSGTAYQQPNKQRHSHSGNGPEMGVNPALINAAAGGVSLGGSVGYSWLA